MKSATSNHRKYLSMYFDMSLRVAEESKCMRKKVGCIIIAESGMIALGFNGMASGQPDTWHNPNDTEHQSNPEVVHAELNALGKMLEQGVSAKGAVVYVTLAPCLECAKLLVRAGVSEVNFIESYRQTCGIDYLIKNGVGVSWYPDYEKGENFL